MRFELTGTSLLLEDIEKIAFNSKSKVLLSQRSRSKILKSRKFVESQIGPNKKPVYGVSTGFGLLSDVQVPVEKLEELQVNLLRSHAVGVGEPLSIAEVRAAILLRANTLAAGFSGISIELIEALLNLLNRNVHPWIPSQGSVGASGDLAPLAHLALVLIGEGKAYYNGSLMSGKEALKKAKLAPYKLKAKEGLSLINGTQIMTAIGALAFMQAERLARLADVSAAMTLEALAGSVTPFDSDIQRIRPHAGQIEVAENMRTLLKKSQIMNSHAHCGKIQDPYSLRCIPQVHGIVRDVLKFVRGILEVEVNSVTDNPLVIADISRPKIVNGGNFHGEYVAIAMDQLAIAVSELANIAEQRIEKLINPMFSGLPAFLIKDGGVNSGFMIVQVAAASLVSENKVLAHPASVDSIPTSADKEDHVSMGTIAARKCKKIIDNSWNVIAMEFLAASQGIDLRKPLKPAKKLDLIHKKIRQKITFIKKDRAYYEDIEILSKLMFDKKFIS